MAEAKGKSTLFAKLAKILGEIGRVSKNGRNEHHGYDYVTETDLVEAVRGKLAENGIAYFFSVDAVDTREVVTVIQNKGEGVEPWSKIPAKAGSVTDVFVTATFADAETGETFSVHGAGSGQDAGDKGVYKALTGAQKYLLMKTFLIATGDDPEGDTKTDKANDEKPAKKTPKAPEEKADPAKNPDWQKQKTEAAKVKTEAREHGEDQTGKVDDMMKILPGGKYKGTAVGALNKEQTTELLAVMPTANSWTKLVQKRHDYLVSFEKLPEPMKQVANELDLENAPAA